MKDPNGSQIFVYLQSIIDCQSSVNFLTSREISLVGFYNTLICGLIRFLWDLNKQPHHAVK